MLIISQVKWFLCYSCWFIPRSTLEFTLLLSLHLEQSLSVNLSALHLCSLTEEAPISCWTSEQNPLCVACLFSTLLVPHSLLSSFPPQHDSQCSNQYGHCVCFQEVPKVSLVSSKASSNLFSLALVVLDHHEYLERCTMPFSVSLNAWKPHDIKLCPSPCSEIPRHRLNLQLLFFLVDVYKTQQHIVWR